jgi:hypothetical protein
MQGGRLIKLGGFLGLAPGHRKQSRWYQKLQLLQRQTGSLMRISSFILGLAASLLLASAAFADDAPAPAASPDEVTSSSHKYYLGVGFFNNLVDANAELVTDNWGNYAWTVGKDSANQLLSHVSWRTHLGEGSGHDSGYYAGVFGGQVEAHSIANKPFRLMGGGADIGYHWVNGETRKIVSVGIGTTKPVDYKGTFQNSQPLIFFSFSIALGLH